MRRLIWLPIAGFLLIAGAAIAAAASAPSITPIARTNQDAASPAPSAAASPSTGNDQNGNPVPVPGKDFGIGHGLPGLGADLLDQVLSDLVKAGTITQAQSDAITQALEQAITDKQNAFEQRQQEAQQQWEQIQGFLSDGVITQDEVNQLPQDSPFRQVFNSIAQDGKITTEQLQQLRLFGPEMDGPGGPGGRGIHIHGMGPGGSWAFPLPGQPQSTPSATGTSS